MSFALVLYPRARPIEVLPEILGPTIQDTSGNMALRVAFQT